MEQKRTSSKRSTNARQVAKKVLEKVGKGEKVSVSKIAREQGYSATMAKNPQKITRTKSYQEEIAPVVKVMKAQRTKILTALSKRNYTKERTRDLIDAMDKLTKNIQLLDDKPTENNALTVTVINYGDTPTT